MPDRVVRVEVAGKLVPLAFTLGAMRGLEEKKIHGLKGISEVLDAEHLEPVRLQPILEEAMTGGRRATSEGVPPPATEADAEAVLNAVPFETIRNHLVLAARLAFYGPPPEKSAPEGQPEGKATGATPATA